MKTNHVLMLMLLITMTLGGCSAYNRISNQLNRNQQPVVSCADSIINRAFDLYEDAKVELASHYENRDPNHLVEAFYHSRDSYETANSVKACADRNITHFHAMKNLKDMNRNLANTVVINMRDEDPMNLIEIYRDKYSKVIPNDIR